MAEAEYIWDGTAWVSTVLGYPGGIPAPTVQKFTASGTWTKPPGLRSMTIEMVGGGGAGGGVAAGATGAVSVGVSAGAGVYLRHTFRAADLPNSSYAVVVGAAGVGASAGAGGSGLASTFGSLLSAAGGNGGGSVTPDLTVPGSPALRGYRQAGGTQPSAAGAGGSGIFGYGGFSPAGSGNGGDAIGYGAGGAGALQFNTTGPYAGGDGSPGLVIITHDFG